MPKTSGSFKRGHKYCGPKEGSFLGHKHSEESKKKIGAASLGRVTSDETRKKLSLALIGKKKSAEHAIKVGLALRGRKQSPEALRKNIESHQGLPSNRKGTKHTEEAKQKNRIAHLGKKHTPEAKEKIRRWVVGHPNRKFNATSIEIKVEKELQKRKLVLDRDYFKQVPLCNVAIVDFYLPESRTVIQCDGCYYHNCLTHYLSEHKEAPVRDSGQDAVLESNGFKVYRFWEHEINESVEGCINRINFKTNDK